MPILNVENGLIRPMPGLGRHQHFDNLSEKRISKAVRKLLRDVYGFCDVQVTCAAEFIEGTWHGKCQIDGAAFGFQISMH